MENSLILKWLDNVLDKIWQVSKQSILIVFVKNMALFFTRLYENSKTFIVVTKFVNYIKKDTRKSKFIRMLCREESLSKVADNSVLFKILNVAVNKPLRWMYMKQLANVPIKYSYVVKLLKYVSDRTYLLLGSFLFIMMIVPDIRWYNFYALITVIILWGFYKFKIMLNDGKVMDFKSIDPVFYFFLVVVVLSFVFSVEPSQSARFLIFYFISASIVFLALNLLDSENKVRTILAFFIGGIFLTAIYGIWQQVTHAIPFDPSLTDVETNQGLPGRIISTMGNPNNYAELLIIAIPWIMASTINSYRKIGKMLYFGVAGVCVGALMLTGSRSSWLGLICAIAVFVLLTKPKLIPGIIIAGIASVPFWPSFVVNRFLTIFNTSADSSARYRVKIFDTVFPVIKDYWISGIGLGTDVFAKITENYNVLTIKVPAHTHILYTQVLLEVGIIGLLLLMWFLGRLIKNSIHMAKRNTSSSLSIFLIAGVSSIAGVLVVSTVEYVWFYPRIMFYFWMNIGLLMATNRISRQNV